VSSSSTSVNVMYCTSLNMPLFILEMPFGRCKVKLELILDIAAVENSMSDGL
jgi:hypothetical protein